MTPIPQFQIGEILPNFCLTAHDGLPSTVDDEMGSQGLVLFVLRGTWCPFCVHQIVATRARYPHFQRRGINVAFIIPEEKYKVDSFRMTVSRPLPFGLHADEASIQADQLAGKLLPGTSRHIGIYLLNRQREIKWQFVGNDDNYPAHRVVIAAIDDTLGTIINQMA